MAYGIELSLGFSETDFEPKKKFLTSVEVRQVRSNWIIIAD